MNELSLQDELTEFLLYTTPNGQVKVEVLLNNETLWLTQKRMAELFGVGVPAISKHLKNIFESGELQEEVVVSILETTTEHGAIAGKTQTNPTKYYNLDAVISVGYRVITMTYNGFTMLKGFSPRNLKYRVKFAKNWNDVEFVQHTAAQLDWRKSNWLLCKMQRKN